MTDFSSANKRIAKNSIFMCLRMIFVLGITLYSTRVVLDILGVENYGIYNVVCGFVGLFSFLSTSMSNGIQRFYNFELGKNGNIGAKKVFNNSIYIQIAVAFLLCIVTEIVGNWYISNKMIIPIERLSSALWIFHFSILSFICVILQVPFMASVMAHEKMDFYSVVSVFDAIAKLVIVFMVPHLSGDNLVIYGCLLVFVSFIELLIYAFYSFTHFEEVKITYKFDRELFLSMLSFSGWNIFGSFSGVMREQGINLIMNLFFGPIVNAARGVANQVNNGLQSFVSNIMVPIRPQVVQSFSVANYDRVMSLTYAVTKYSCLFLYFVSLPILFEIDYILSLWLGDNVPEYSSSFVVIIVITSFINNLNAAVSGVVHASGKMKKYQLVGAVINLLALPLVYIYLKLGGNAVFALVIVSIVSLLNQVACLFVLKGIINYSLVTYFQMGLLPVLKVILVTLIFPFIITMCLEPNFYRLFLTTATSLVSVLIAVYIVGMTSIERKTLYNYLRNYMFRIFCK